MPRSSGRALEADQKGIANHNRIVHDGICEVQASASAMPSSRQAIRCCCISQNCSDRRARLAHCDLPSIARQRRSPIRVILKKFYIAYERVANPSTNNKPIEHIGRAAFLNEIIHGYVE